MCDPVDKSEAGGVYIHDINGSYIYQTVHVPWNVLEYLGLKQKHVQQMIEDVKINSDLQSG